MGKKEFCLTHDTIGVIVFSMSKQISIKGIEYGADDYIYYQFEHGDNITFHKSMIRYNCGKLCFMFKNMRIYFDEIIKYEEYWYNDTIPMRKNTIYGG